VKRLQIMMEEDLDESLDRLAAQQRVSKAALIRRFVREAINPLPPLESDPLTAMIGVDDIDPTDIDDVVHR
jgi:hypothetical protein